MYSETSVTDIPDRLGIGKKYKHLATVMGLPLVDGVFVSIVLSDGLTSISDAVLVGMFVLGGFATIGVIISEFDGSKRNMMKNTIYMGIGIAIFAVLQAVLAPSISAFVNTETFKYGAMLALCSISIQILPIDITDRMLGPTPIVVISLLFSLQLDEPLVISYSTGIAIYALLAVGIALVICLLTIMARDRLVGVIDENTMRYATALGLIMVMMSIGGYVPDMAPTVSFAGMLLSFDSFNDLLPF